MEKHWSNIVNSVIWSVMNCICAGNTLSSVALQRLQLLQTCSSSQHTLPSGGKQSPAQRLLKLGLRVPTHDQRWLSHCFPMVRAVAPSWVQRCPRRGARLRMAPERSKFKFQLWPRMPPTFPKCNQWNVCGAEATHACRGGGEWWRKSVIHGETSASDAAAKSVNRQAY